MPEPREDAVRYVAHVEDSLFGPLSEKDADYLRKNAPPGLPTRFWIRQLAPPTFFPEGRGWVVLMIEDKVPTDAVGPLRYRTGCGRGAKGTLPPRCTWIRRAAPSTRGAPRLAVTSRRVLRQHWTGPRVPSRTNQDGSIKCCFGQVGELPPSTQSSNNRQFMASRSSPRHRFGSLPRGWGSHRSP